MQVVNEYIAKVHAANLYPHHYVIHEKRGNRVRVECETSGKMFDALNFGSNDILGLAQHEDVTAAAIAAIQQFGTSNSSCATLSGRINPHRQLEQAISRFKGLPHTYLFLNAWMALQAVMDGFCHLAIPVKDFQHTRETLILTDLLNHGCITSAVVNADNRSGKMLTQSPKVRTKTYKHVDMANLASKLERFARTDDRIIVVTDAVFSMDGDIVPLPEMLDVLARYPNCVLILDEAHSSGALGSTGHGVLEHFGLTADDIAARGIELVILTTFSKFAASAGAAISCYSKAFAELLDACPTSIGTISLPPANTAAALAAIQTLEKHPQWVGQLHDNTRRFRQMLKAANFDVLGETNVVPILIDQHVSPKVFARHLLEHHGIWVSPVWFIAKPRIRVVVNALQTDSELEQLVDALVATRQALES